MKKLVRKNQFKVGLYVRCSTEEQGAKLNPEGTIKNQTERVLNEISRRNSLGLDYEIVEVFVDDGISAKDTKRPALQRMLKLIEIGKINLVMVTEYSRLSRNLRDFTQMWDLFKHHGCMLVSLRENFDTSTAAGEMMLFNMANLSQYERRTTSERVVASRIDRSLRGLFNGGPIPLGYKSVPLKAGYLEINQLEAKSIRAAYDAFLRLGSLSQAAKWLNDNGYIPERLLKDGTKKVKVGHFTIGYLGSILKSKTYLGLVEFKRGDELLKVEANLIRRHLAAFKLN